MNHDDFLAYHEHIVLFKVPAPQLQNMLGINE